jgi:hypothetical protein
VDELLGELNEGGYYAVGQRFSNVGSRGLFDGSRCENQNVKIDGRRCKSSPTAPARLNVNVLLFTQQLIKYNTGIFKKNVVSNLPLIDKLWFVRRKNF